MNAVEQHDDYFQQKRNAANQKGLSCLQKVTTVFRILTYGVPTDATDEYLRIGESTTLESLRRFVKAVIEVFGDEYLRSPNENDIARLLALGAERGGKVCSAHLTACIGGGRIAHPHGKVSVRATIIHLQ
jgi:hypothetical protein